MIDVLQEVRWMLGMKGRRYKLWWSRKGGVGSVGVMVMEELSEKVVEVRKVSDKVMTVVVFQEDVLWFICEHAPQNGRSFEEKESFY